MSEIFPRTSFKFTRSRYPYRWTKSIYCSGSFLPFMSAIWLMLRTGRKPTRIVYPCQQAAVANIKIFHLALLAPIPPTILSLRKSARYLNSCLFWLH